MSITTNQQGFIFPYVLFIIALTLIVITASVQLYQSEIHITQNQTEQLKIETLFQMAHTQFKEDITKQSESSGTISYELPYGDVLVEYGQLNEREYPTNFIMETDTGATHNINNRISIDYE
ncbi:hypothetical protein [Lentibacillus sp. CBA3610]|uniref:hypothetical protein n=1 Tax=Lentibacillus sp. CBA3610 TaxID=2518176 RepID=UPI00159548C3|nr:hypothetical protein [Lentibacillus sp. CBA3610]QKY69447.1 hypothetical protein Len3610_07420 [Lentibacillus sp. CBA3610]